MSAAKAKDGGSALIGYDVATALWQGKRPYQEDSLLADFHGGMDRGFAVLADGMGGHAAGDLASRLVVIDAVSHLKFLMHDGASLEKNLHAELTSAIETANDVLKDRGSNDRRLQGMGATFLATVMFEDRLYWASVGDSPLYLWREGELRQLNEDHSMAPIIDQMAKTGELSAEEAANHPDRNALTSVLMGGKLKSIDVPKTAMVLDPGDVLIQASDGLQYLDEARIASVLDGLEDGASSRVVADALMQALYDLDDPVQDNTAIMVLQLCKGLDDGSGKTSGKGSDAKSAGERTGIAAAVAMIKQGDAGPAASRMLSNDGDVEGDLTEDASATAVAPDTPAAPPPEGRRRRILVPAALLGGAALALGLYFGLPSEQEGALTEAALADEDAKGPGGDPAAAMPDDTVAEVEGDAETDADADAGLGEVADDAPEGEPAADVAETPDEVVLDNEPVNEEAAGEIEETPSQDPDVDADPETPSVVEAQPDAGATDAEATTPDETPNETPAEALDGLANGVDAPAAPEVPAAPEAPAVPEAVDGDDTAVSEAAPQADPDTPSETPTDAPDINAEGASAEEMPQEITSEAPTSTDLGVTPTEVPSAPDPLAPAAPAPLPAPTPTPVPEADGVTPSPVPGAGPIRETLDANDASAPLQPQPQPQVVPLGPQITQPGLTQDDRAGQTGPLAPSADAPGVPMLPPFAGNIQRICQGQQCFAIIRQPDGSVAILQRRR